MATTKFYPSNDGYIQTPNSTSWATVHDAASGSSVSNGADAYVYTRKIDSNYSMAVHFANYDTSSIPDTDTVTDATLGLYGFGKDGTQSQSWNIYSSTASDTLVKEDFDLRGGTAYCDTAISQASFNASGYNTWAFNTAGKSAVSKTGLTKVCLREVVNDVGNSAPSVKENIYIGIKQAAATGTSQDPYLEVTHAGGSSSSVKTVNGLAKASVKTVNGLAIASVKTWNGLA